MKTRKNTHGENQELSFTFSVLSALSSVFYTHCVGIRSSQAHHIVYTIYSTDEETKFKRTVLPDVIQHSIVQTGKNKTNEMKKNLFVSYLVQKGREHPGNQEGDG